MKKIYTLLVLIISTTAFAHVETGLYRGTTPEGQACEMRAVGMQFENGLHHPLSERVILEYAGETFTVGHPSAIVRADSQITFNHDLFQGILPNARGAKALIVEMIHSTQYEGPSAFEVIDHNWLAKSSTKVRCNDIKLIK